MIGSNNKTTLGKELDENYYNKINDNIINELYKKDEYVNKKPTYQTFNIRIVQENEILGLEDKLDY